MNSKPLFNQGVVNNTQSNMHRGKTYDASLINPGQGSTLRSKVGGGCGEAVGCGSRTGEDLYKYKAKKYHYKCQAKLLAMQKDATQKNPHQAWVCPTGYETYLNPFQE